MKKIKETQEGFFYNQDDIIVRRSEIKDIRKLADKLRATDIVEVWSSHHYKPNEAVRKSFEQSLISLTIENKGSVIGMFGISTENILGQEASIWLLASSELDNICIRFLKHCRGFVNMFLDYYPKLSNFVDVRNTKSIEWLRYLGARIEEAKPFGVEQLPFHQFTFERK